VTLASLLHEAVSVLVPPNGLETSNYELEISGQSLSEKSLNEKNERFGIILLSRFKEQFLH